ncbi:MAG: lipoyl(octanoyl) transferase LipB [Mariprofundaceae bacterium]|nr:lipoyl(octanoyl) transferase LipB [Mariprofundaceae bacterium]
MSPAFEWLAVQPYEVMWQKMKVHAALLAEGKADEVIWACEHKPVYTTGKRAIDNRLDVVLPAPLIETDRGGETTFHGRGQVMLYPIISLRKRGFTARQYIELLEESAIQVLSDYGITAERRCGLPGVWTNKGKIVAMGIRISQGVAYHGMAMNMAVDMTYFKAINPCGLGQNTVNMQDSLDVLPSSNVLAQVWSTALRDLL